MEHGNQVLTLLYQQGPFVVLLSFIIFAGYKRWWVWGYQLVQAEARCEKLEAIVFRQLQVTNKAVELAEKTTERHP